MVKDSIKYLQDQTDLLSKNITTRRKPFKEDESRKLVDLIQSLGKTARLVEDLEAKWGKDLTSFVITFFNKRKAEKR